MSKSKYQTFLDDQDDRHKQYADVRQNFPRRKVEVNDVGEILAIDLMVYPYGNNKIAYILVAIELYSRKVSLTLLHEKNMVELARGLENAVDELGVPEKIWSDKESAVYALETQLKQRWDVTLYSTANSYKGVGTHSVPHVERFNRTFKMIFNRLRTGNTLEKLNKAIHEFQEQYNNTVHSSTGFKPNELYANPNLKHDEVPEVPENPKVVYKVGDNVYYVDKTETIASKYRKKYLPGTIKSVNVSREPTVYYLNEVPGAFYEQQLKSRK